MYFGFQDISIAYGKRTVLEKVNLSFEKGKITSIIGPNGCGKSSLLKAVSRVVTPVSGQVIFEDRPIRSYPPKELAKKIAYLPQVHSSPKDIDIRTLVSYGRYPYKRFGAGLTEEDRRIINETLVLTGLDRMGSRSLNNLSGGEKQRAWIAMTICQQPEILLLDEPITYLDVGYQVEVLELIKKLGEQLKITIVMVLHDMNFTARYSHRIYVLKDRRVHGYGTPDEIIEQEKMRQVFGIGSQILYDEKNVCPFLIPEKLEKAGGIEDSRSFSIKSF